MQMTEPTNEQLIAAYDAAIPDKAFSMLHKVTAANIWLSAFRAAGIIPADAAQYTLPPGTGVVENGKIRLSVSDGFLHVGYLPNSDEISVPVDQVSWLIAAIAALAKAGTK
jgi:hypothetical protein